VIVIDAMGLVVETAMVLLFPAVRARGTVMLD
jgi:hypothetical protein